MILVDSSVWIEAWRGKNPSVTTSLARLIESGEATLNPLIRTEILQGARDLGHQKFLKELLSSVSIEPLPEDLWEEAPALYLKLRQKGITLTTIDCLIASHSMIKSLALWSLDQTFEKIPELKKYIVTSL